VHILFNLVGDVCCSHLAQLKGNVAARQGIALEDVEDGVANCCANTCSCIGG